MEDKIIWTRSLDGVHSAKSFCQEFFDVNGTSTSLWDHIWTGFIPPKMEAFCWQLLKGRVAVKLGVLCGVFLGSVTRIFSASLKNGSHLFLAEMRNYHGECLLRQLCRIASWIKVRWPQVNMPLSDLVLHVQNFVIPAKRVVHRPVLCWSKPEVGWVKFNVDGSSLGKPGLLGIRGILRDHEGVELIRFSKHVGILDSNEDELIVVNEALALFVSSKWVHNSFLIIESDSQYVVSWVNRPSSVPWQ
ncbi:hypothetical protein PTKIN_Ptkin06aG0176700 [Pterospermum kingtungense]